MRCVVVGAGAWGLPAAAELAGRGHDVVLVDRHGVGNRFSSSPGPTRLWRLTHPDAVRVRLARRSLEAMERLSRSAGQEVFLRRGLLWRDHVSGPAVIEALTAEGVEHEVVAAADVGRFFPGLRPDGRDAVWQVEAGPVLAAVSLAAQADLLARAGGTVVRTEVVEVAPHDHGARVHCRDGQVLEADRVVLAPGPGAGPLLATLGVDVPLRPLLEQVVHVGDRSADDFPCLVDGPLGDQPGLYAMPTPGLGYKIGLDLPLRDLHDDDVDRTPDDRVSALVGDRVRRDLTALRPDVVDAQVCCWTMSPDGRFIVDTLPNGIVLACGDSGEGFKFSALMGLVLADLAEGAEPDDDVASFGLARFALRG